jgi:hypothetical protein
VAAWVPLRFCDFYAAKNNKIVNNLTTTDDKFKKSTDLESLKIYKIFDAWFGLI